MFFAEFAFAVLVYNCVLRQLPHYTIIFAPNPFFIKKSLVVFSLITILQLLMFVYNEHNYHPQAAQLNFISIATLALVIPFYEEIFYRGCLFGFICAVYKRNFFIPAIITSLLFCLMHTQYSSFLYQAVLFLFSCMLIHIRIITKSLAYPIILHSAMNSLVIFLNIQSVYR